MSNFKENTKTLRSYSLQARFWASLFRGGANNHRAALSRNAKFHPSLFGVQTGDYSTFRTHGMSSTNLYRKIFTDTTHAFFLTFSVQSCEHLVLDLNKTTALMHCFWNRNLGVRPFARKARHLSTWTWAEATISSHVMSRLVYARFWVSVDVWCSTVQ